MRYIYGPVKSRRLGFSLGVNVIPYKTCSFNCIYCQLGETTCHTFSAEEYIKVSDIITELSEFFKTYPQKTKNINYITLSGSGEPTLNSSLDKLIEYIRKITNIPIAIITNSSLLDIKEIRQKLLGAHLILPSLDAANEEIFRKINQPTDNLRIQDIIKGLITLRQEFKGRICLEVMLLRGINDKLAHIRELKEAIEKIKPDKVQLNSPIRLPQQTKVQIFSPGERKIEKIKEILQPNCEII